MSSVLWLHYVFTAALVYAVFLKWLILKVSFFSSGHPIRASMVWKYSLVVRLLLSAWSVHTHLHCQQVGQLSTNLHGPEENFCEVDCKCTVTHSVSKTPGTLPPFCYLDIALGYHVTTLEYIDLLKTTFIRNVYSSLWPLRDTTVLYLCWEGIIYTIQEFHLLCRSGPGSSVTPCIHSFPYSNSNDSWAQSLGQHIGRQRAHRQQVAAQISGEWRQCVLTRRLSPPFSIKWEPECWCSLPVSLCCVVLPVSLCCLAPQTWNFAFSCVPFPSLVPSVDLLPNSGSDSLHMAFL